MPTTLTLARLNSPLAAPERQRRVLAEAGHESFARRVGGALRSAGIGVLQVNVGKLCNQTCRHCHVDAGPDRREVMPRETMRACLDAMAAADIGTLDVTGGAPEMNPHFRWFVGQARAAGRHVIDRCNLTILVAPGFRDVPEFLAEHEVEVVASLPCYGPENTDAQRGDGVFAKSIEALRRLNALGYGHPGSGKTLTLVYNPGGPSLPPPQESLEAAYRRELGEEFGVVFNRLHTITNMPISRFLDDLLEAGRLDEYMRKLIDAYNPATVEGLMCRHTLSVGWDGRLYDCDFNQMLDVPVVGRPRTIFEFEASLTDRAIAVNQHCYGCTAGSGSGCQGAIVGTAS